MGEKVFDLIIIGGGIHGAGAAQAASAGGHSVLLLEKTGLGSGTSGKSSKLIHGGLRYLETGQFKLVGECLRERALLLKNAPGLVKLQKVYIPVYSDTKRRPIIIRVGLSLYYILSGFNPDSGFRSVPKKEWGALDGLDTTGLQAVFQYHEAQTDDAALTKSVMESAVSLGAELKMPADFTGAVYENGGWTVRWKENGAGKSARGTFLLNAGGPWANEVLGEILPKQEKVAVDLVQGAHVIVDGKMEGGIYYVEAPTDHRGVFVIPWKGRVMIGTTETPFDKNLSEVAPLEEEIDYLLKTAAHYFPQFRPLRREDVRESFAGLRVLPSGDGNPFHRSRETLIHESPSAERLASIFGGKLTSYRATSEAVLKKIEPFLPAKKPVADTKTILLK
ncbi:MAG: FAD-dependent oxidoreductase [Nitrospinae bacterium]|nr:FAD-dependent oxidoreductase [Nitrospinota bacterium]